MRLLTLALAAVLGAGCPLPQPVVGVSADGGVTITPPQIDTSSAQPTLPITEYGPPASCDGGAQFTVVANVIDLNTTEQDVVRWFVDYDPTTQPGITILSTETLFGSSDQSVTLRKPTPVTFQPSDYDDPVPRAHVLQIAVSNGFQAPTTEPSLDGGMPNMEAAAGYQVQVFRWTFEPTADGGCGP